MGGRESTIVMEINTSFTDISNCKIVKKSNKYLPILSCRKYLIEAYKPIMQRKISITNGVIDKPSRTLIIFEKITNEIEPKIENADKIKL